MERNVADAPSLTPDVGCRMMTMNKLQRDTRVLIIAQLAIAGFFVSLGILKAVRVHLRLTEQEFYRQYPLGWWVVVILGFGFIASLLLAVKKSVDTHPNIQLRKKPDQILEDVLADPSYSPWHAEAARLLEQRRTARKHTE